MKIALLGDVALIGCFDQTNGNDVCANVSAVKDAVKDCDFVIANLESPLTRKDKTIVCKGAYLRSDPSNIEVLKQIGVTHVSLANNHVYDYGTEGAVETQNALKKNGIAFVGLGDQPAVLEKDGDKALLDGFCCYSANAVRYGATKGKVQLLSKQALNRFFSTASEKKSVPIASIHFGIEGVHYPSLEHMRLFRMYADKTDYVLHGNHPHAIQGYERIKNSFLFYALGNLCFDDIVHTSIHNTCYLSNENRKTYIVLLTITNNTIESYEIKTFYIRQGGKIIADESIESELQTYTKTLSESEEVIKAARKKELNGGSPVEKNAKFFMDRFNWKYIGAFMNGQIHAIKYKKVMSDFL